MAHSGAIFDATLARNSAQATAALEQHIFLTFEAIRMLVPAMDGKPAATRKGEKC